ncbi:SDR family oxidoreductase [Pseudonocardia sp. RS010]|uniref:SDR family oxidoreductase n=1 Tax=Pseudonocardia sp. RS010 TaxID=3385979 RepID=UPI00399F0634
MRVLVIGATGYVGTRLVPRLLDEGHPVRCLVRSPDRLARAGFADRVEVVRGSVADPAATGEACRGVDAVVHLVHSMDGPDFADRDRVAARAVAAAAAAGGVRRIVYLGGLQPSAAAGNSAHLGSRREVGEILLGAPVPAAVLQAGIVVGHGSASFEMIRHLAETVLGGPPVLPLPDQAWNRVQPIAIDDVLYWLTACLRLPPEVNRAFDVGGPDAPSYVELLRGYAREAGLTRALTVPVPVAAPRLGARAVEALTPVDRELAGPLLESMAYDLVCRESDLSALVGEPPGGPTRYREAVRRALAEEGAAGSAATDPAGSGPPALSGRHVEEVDAPPEVLWSVVAGLGGDEGWRTVPGAWELRQRLDGLIGGVGLRRGRPARLEPGAPVDWWRVEEIERGRLLALRAEARLPGVARLRMTVEPAGRGASRYTQTVTFRPRGLAGRLYWYAQKPGHDLVFGVMARMVVFEAERRAAQPGPPNDAAQHPERV